jgi:hypothetical protein
MYIRTECGRITTLDNTYKSSNQLFFKDNHYHCEINLKEDNLIGVLEVNDIGIDKNNREVLVIEKFKGDYIYWTDGTTTHKTDINNFEFITHEQYMKLAQEIK